MKKITMTMRHPIVGGLVVLILGGIAKIFSSYLLWAWELILWIIAALAAKHPTPGWVLLVMGLLVLVGLLACLRLILKKCRQPSFKKYTEDTIEGIVWRWQWNIDKQAKTARMVNLDCFCSKCDTKLVWDEDGNRFLCEQCPLCYLKGKSMGWKSFEEKVEREIEQRVRRKYGKEYSL